MIRLDNVTKTFLEGQPAEVRALRGVTLEIDTKAVSVFKGPSGSGKTTLLTLVGALARPSSGRVLLDGELISNLPEKFLTELRRRRFGFVFQRFNLIRGLSALENVMLPAYPLAPPHGELEKRARELLARLDVGRRAEMKVEMLSGGEAQRVAVARALVNDPQIIIADEPTANLDTRLAMQFLDIIADLHEEGRGVIMTSHDPRIWGADVVSRVIAMEDGRIVGDENGKGGKRREGGDGSEGDEDGERGKGGKEGESG
jgi:putative ABC transport system ATP-binding protein